MDFTSLRTDPTLWPILEDRAHALAQQATAHDEQLGADVVIFQLGSGRYSLVAHYIREVQPLERVRRLPGTPAWMLGLVNVRGQVLCVLDLRPLLDMAPAPLPPGAALVVVRCQGLDLALAADTVAEVRRGSQTLAPALATANGGGVPWVQGIDGDLTLVLDVPLLLRDPRVQVNHTVN